MREEFPQMYLGDGVYANYDGYHVVLELKEQESAPKIFLDPDVIKAMGDYMKTIHGIVKERQGEQDE